MSAQPRIRRALPADAAVIAEVLRLAFLEFEPQYTPEAFAATTPDESLVRQRMDEGPAWVASCKEQVAGTASAVLEGQKGLYVRGVAVVPSLRGLGIAGLLMGHIESFARQQGCRRLFLTTTPFLTGAIRLYQRLGFVTNPSGAADLFGTPLLKMEKELDFS